MNSRLQTGQHAMILRRAAAIPGVAYILAALIACFSLAASGFASLANFGNIGLQSATLLMLALPMTLIIMSEGLDLSMGAVVGLCGVVLALALVKGESVGVALAAALVVGLAFGFLNGVLVVTVGIPPFVATLGTFGIAQSLALVPTDGQSVVGIGEALPALYASDFFGVPFPLLVAGLMYLPFHFVLYHTRFGAYVFAIGGNREALVLAGAHANRYHIGIYMLGGLMAGAAALLLTGRMNVGHPIAAIGMEFDAIAAVVVGGTALERGNGWLPGTLLGVLTVGVLKNGLNVMAVPSSLQVASIGLLVIVTLLIDAVRGKS